MCSRSIRQGGYQLHPGVLLPHRTELGQPRLFSASRSRRLTAGEVLGAFLAQFYDDKPCPRLHPRSRTKCRSARCSPKRCRPRADCKVEVAVPKRGEKTRPGRSCARQCARGARPQARGHVVAAARCSKSFARAVRAAAHCRADRGLRQQPHPGHERGRRDGRRGAGRLREKPVSQVQHPLGRPHAGRRLRHDARGAEAPLQAAAQRSSAKPARDAAIAGDARRRQSRRRTTPISPWPDLVLIDGGQGQLTAARETLARARRHRCAAGRDRQGPDRDAGRETFFMPGREPFRLPPRDPLLYFVERLRDEAHRFAIGSHRAAPQQGHPRRRLAGNPRHRADAQARAAASFRHAEGDRARLARRSRQSVPASTPRRARKIYDFFHERPT